MVQPSPGGTTSPCALQRDRGSRSEALAHDEVGRGDHAVGADDVGRHRMPLDREAEPFEQLGRALRVRRAVARRVVGRNLHQLGEEPRLVVALCRRGSPRSCGRGTLAWLGLQAAGWKCSMKRRKTRADSLGILDRDRFQRVVADAALAADEQHADVGEVDHRHPVVARAGRQPAHRQPFGLDRPPICSCSQRRAGGGHRPRASAGSRPSRLRRAQIAAMAASTSAAACRRCSSRGARMSIVKRAWPGITLVAPGAASMRPTVPTSSGSLRAAATRSPARIPRPRRARRAAASSARCRRGRRCPSISTAKRFAPLIAVTTPTGRPSASSTGPCSMWSSA